MNFYLLNQLINQLGVAVKLRNYDEMAYHPVSEKLVQILQTKTQNTNPLFFRVLVAYYFGVVAAQMGAQISGWAGKGNIPINVYAFNLSPSGTGKGHSSTLIESEVLNQFREIFTEYTFPQMAAANLEKLSAKRAIRNGSDPNDELKKLEKDFISLGALLFTFDSASTAAIKQMRQKVLMAGVGACNLQVDEIGANLSGSSEALTTYLELFDKGLVKDKLLKSTADTLRFEKIDGATPSNMLLFGTPSKLLDGGATESLLMELLDMGYARRCFFGIILKASKVQGLSPDEVMAQLFDNTNDEFLEKLSERLGALADRVNINKVIHLPRDIARILIEYKLACEKQGTLLNDNENIRRSELEHRYFKVLKLAGAFAFIDSSPEITQEHLENAIKLAEDSGVAFNLLMTPERPYIKLAKYLAQAKSDVTLPDLDADLPYFRGSKTQKEDMISMATAYGYKNNIIIKKAFNDGIMFLSGESIERTNLDKMILSYSSDMTEGYQNAEAPFNKLSNLISLPDYHWLNHHLLNGYDKDPATGGFLGYRLEENCLRGFNLLVLDVDGKINLSTAKLLLKDYAALYYTTKRHTESEHRFRIVLPMNYTLKMDAKEYKEFFNNIMEGLPFEIDTSTSHRCKKWLTHAGDVSYTKGELFDVLPYIPKTSKNDDRTKLLQDQQAMDNLERWVLNNTGSGNRSNMLIRYALILVDAGFDFDAVRLKILDLNNKLADKLDEAEITATILKTVVKALASRP